MLKNSEHGQFEQFMVSFCCFQAVPTDVAKHMPGRQVTAFLFLYNMAQWLVLSFEIQKV